jgi:hypothetical protein
MGGLFVFTFAVNFVALILSLWLGIYLVTRNSKYLIAWLTALTLWFLTGVFLNVLLALNTASEHAYWPAWLQFLFPFWPERVFNGDSSAWLQGWSFVPAIAFWLHVTFLMRPGELKIWHKLCILAGYLIAIFAILVQKYTPILFTVQNSDPLYLNGLKAGPYYPAFGIAIIVFTMVSVNNLLAASEAKPAIVTYEQVRILIWATVITGLVVPLTLAGSAYQLPIPLVFLSLTLAIPVGMIGYGMARYSSLMQGRTVRRDFIYNLALLGLVLAVYLLLSWILIHTYQAPAIVLVFVPMLAVVTHMLMNPAYRLMDTIFYQPHTRRVRDDLRRLLRLASEGNAFEDNLNNALGNLCTTIHANYGLILTFEGESVSKAADFGFRRYLPHLAPSDLIRDDVVPLQPGQFQPPLEDAALLVPLYAESRQLGALVLGRPENGLQYAPEEIDRLLNIADQISEVIYIAHLKVNYMQQMVELSEAQHHQPAEKPPVVLVDDVEDALRNLYDYAYLADSPLAKLEQVRSRLAQNEMTHLERGKIVHEILETALDKLCPQSAMPRDPPPREWYPYLILKDAYKEEMPNRDIMLHLYISEGTFNRTRRQAIRSVARALGEMEVSPH